MNNQIKECGIEVSIPLYYLDVEAEKGQELEKFAEQVIQTCVLAVYAQSKANGDEWATTVSLINAIRDKFGVKV